MPAAPPSIDPQWIERAATLAMRPGRSILGLVGPPGAGKSTFAKALRVSLAARGLAVQVVPMDGYHMANAELARLGRAGRKGAPDTFDAAGFVALLQRLRAPGAADAGRTILAPEFRREIEEPIAGAIAVEPDARLVITEGNYLLLDEAPWSHVAALLDESWYLDGPDDARTERLVERHQRFGRSAQQAVDWVASTDAPNAVRIAATRARATAIVPWG